MHETKGIHRCTRTAHPSITKHQAQYQASILSTKHNTLSGDGFVDDCGVGADKELVGVVFGALKARALCELAVR